MVIVVAVPFTGWTLFLSPEQQHQSTEENLKPLSTAAMSQHFIFTFSRQFSQVYQSARLVVTLRNKQE